MCQENNFHLSKVSEQRSGHQEDVELDSQGLGMLP